MACYLPSKKYQHWPKADNEEPDDVPKLPELETDLDAKLSDFCKHWDNLEQPCSDKDSESLTSEDEDLEEEAVEQS